MQETWLPITGLQGYEVSDLGRVRSVDRVVNKTYPGGRVMPARYKGRILKLPPSGVGYPVLNLRGRRAYLHQLVLETFVGPRPGGYYAAHGDGDKLHNALANLRWASPRENAADKLQHGTAMFGTKNPQGRKTHCKHGHRFDDQNTRRYPNGWRTCRACHRDWERRHRAATATAAKRKGAGVMPAPGWIGG